MSGEKFKGYELVDLTEKHKQLILDWRNSEHVRMNMFNENVITGEEHDKWFKNTKSDNKIMAKLLLFKEKPIGFVNFTNIDYRNDKCYWGFYIGEKDAPKGSGKIMALLALNYIFHQYSLRKLCSEVLEFNHKSISYHKKLGFVQEGRLKKHIFKNDDYVDVILFALFKEDWERSKGQLLKELGGDANGAHNY